MNLDFIDLKIKVKIEKMFFFICKINKSYWTLNTQRI
jgi:hypothetical protein